MPEGSGSHIDYSENLGTQLSGTPRQFEVALCESCRSGRCRERQTTFFPRQHFLNFHSLVVKKEEQRMGVGSPWRRGKKWEQ